MSDDNKAFSVCTRIREREYGYVSVCCGGTEHVKQDVTIELELDDQILAQYNKINFDIEESKFAKELKSDRYNIPTYRTVLKADSEDNYALLPITVNPDGLSPDSIYMIPLRIKSISNYEINPDKQQVLYQVVLKKRVRDYGIDDPLSDCGNRDQNYHYRRESQRFERNPSRSSDQKTEYGYSSELILYTPGKVTKEDIDKYGMYLTINDDKSITITPCGSLQVEMIGGAEDNYYEVDKKADRYSICTTNISTPMLR